MKKSNLLMSAILMAMFTSTSMAASIAATASANVLTPLSVTETTQMNFGSVAGDKDASTTVVLTTSNTVIAGPGAYATGAVNSAVFTVLGASNAAYTITLPATITLTGPGTSMVVDSITNTSTSLLDVVGTEIVNVGGTLTINPNQATGLYTGTYPVQVSY